MYQFLSYARHEIIYFSLEAQVHQIWNAHTSFFLFSFRKPRNTVRGLKPYRQLHSSIFTAGIFRRCFLNNILVMKHHLYLYIFCQLLLWNINFRKVCLDYGFKIKSTILLHILRHKYYIANKYKFSNWETYFHNKMLFAIILWWSVLFLCLHYVHGGFLERMIMMMMLGRKIIWLMFLLYLSPRLPAASATFAVTLLLWPEKSSLTLNLIWVSKCRYSLGIVEYLTSPINLLFNLYSLCLYEDRPHNEFYEYCGVVLNQPLFERESKCWKV